MQNPLLKKINKLDKSSTTTSLLGVTVKEIFLIVLMIASMIATIQLGYVDITMTIIAGIIGFILALIVAFKPNLAPVLAPLYAIAEGALLSAVVVLLEAQFSGIAIHAVIITVAIALLMAIVYSKEVIKVTSDFQCGIFVCLFVIIAYYMFGFIFDINIYNSLLSLCINLIIAIVASLCLLIDYKLITEAIDNNMSEEYEWYCAFSLLVTLIWLYVEILDVLRQIYKD